MVLNWLRGKWQAIAVHLWAARRTHAAAESIDRTLKIVTQAHLDLARSALSASDPRAREPGSLLLSGYQVYSQCDEDGMIAEIFRRIGVSNRYFVEFGVGDGMENCTTYLAMTGWSGLWIEASDEFASRIRQGFAPLLSAGRLTLLQHAVTAENIESLLESGGVPLEPDLMSIDIDGNDYWVLQAINRWKPRVLVLEYNAALGPEADLTVQYDAASMWDGTRIHGASLAALTRLANARGYRLVGCNFAGVNAFFVREDLVADHFAAPFTAAHHFQPPRFYLAQHMGHRRSIDESRRFCQPDPAASTAARS